MNSRIPLGSLGVLAAALALLVAGPAQAHVGLGQPFGFGSGFEHPISGWDHIAAMIAVGLWGAQLGLPAMWVLPVAFPTVMALGGLLGLLGVPLPGVEIGIGLSAFVLGAMVLFEVKPALWVALVLVAIFAIFHGYAHGAELPPGENGLLYSIGFVIATGLLHATGIAIGLILRWNTGRYAVRGLGTVIAAAGVYFLYDSLIA